MSGAVRLWRGVVADVPRDPFLAGDAALRFERDGGLAVGAGGSVLARGPFERLRADFPRAEVVERPGAWILPGFVDLHVHFPQTRIVGARGAELLDWLDRYVFAEEMRLSAPAYAADVARVFCEQLVRNGTTTALVFGSHDPGAVAACFREGERRRLRFVLGKVLHGDGVPAPMRDDPRAALDACRALVADWHGRGKMRYAVTPRFALTSTPDTYALCRELLAATPGLAVTTHWSENAEEIRKTRALRPDARDYADVYDREGLLGPRTVLAHGVYGSREELAVLAARGTSVAHCPSSNFFLGSGVAGVHAVRGAGVNVGLGCDVGAGTSFSLLGECGDAYKASALAGRPLTSAQLLWLATGGGAAALGLADEIGCLEPGRRADFVVLDPSRDAYLPERLAAATDDADALFALLMLARTHCVAATVVDGVEA